MSWINYGDVNFAAYGGCLCRPQSGSEEREDIVEVIEYDPERKLGDKELAVHMWVDTRALSDDDIRDILIADGLDDALSLPRADIFAKYGNGIIAKEAVSVLGDNRFPMSNANGTDFFDYESMFMAPADLPAWFSSYGADGFVA